ncbi:molybdate ABC transporter permease subunit [Berryella wangjianweii]|uniref:Molybdate ABC transporter permease subunit n=1 Tax=Berryella wangjianweii TaxID=2734634 RepID=A0A6M8J530_9ACTN|nr:molybdate ABC transporter permease subunit [Berryella wangjianweii]QKF07733.1 molybdate ABC transporter permease subunit [Berryella wangjianweii]
MGETMRVMRSRCGASRAWALALVCVGVALAIWPASITAGPAALSSWANCAFADESSSGQQAGAAMSAQVGTGAPTEGSPVAQPVEPAADSVARVGAGLRAVTLDVGHSERAGAASVLADGASALMKGSDWALSSFARQNKGTSRAVEGQSLGYRWPLSQPDAVAAVVTQQAVIVRVPARLADGTPVPTDDPAFIMTLMALLQALDDRAAEGGEPLGLEARTVYVTTQQQVSLNGFTYDFGREAGGRTYVTCVSEGSADDRAGALLMEAASLVPSASLGAAEQPSALDGAASFFGRLDLAPLWVSLRTTGAAIVAIFALGLACAWLTMRTSSRVKGLLDTVFTIPLVLPPTVCGFLLLLAFGNSTATGRWLIDHGISLVFTWEAAVISCVVVGFPMMYRTVRGAFENLDASMLDAARTLGWSEARIFARIMLPLAWPSIAAGTVLAFARAMGEFGCTLFFAGNYLGVTQTIPLAIYFEWMSGRTDVALFWVGVVLVVSFAVILVINAYSSRTQRYRRKERGTWESS